MVVRLIQSAEEVSTLARYDKASGDSRSTRLVELCNKHGIDPAEVFIFGYRPKDVTGWVAYLATCVVSMEGPQGQHRTDGPAVYFEGGRCEVWIDGELMMEIEA